MVHRIDGPGATAGNEWTEGDPTLGVPYTEATDDWLNMVQEELEAVVLGAGLATAKGNNSQVLQALGILGGAGYSNACLNSRFLWWQRKPSGLTLPISGAERYYCADRWVADCGDSGAATVIPNPTTFGDMFGGTRYAGEFPVQTLQFDQTTGSSATRNPALYQRVPELRALAAGSVVVSFRAAVASGTLSITPKLTQYFSGGFGASSSVVVTGTPITVTTTPTTYYQVLTLPSLNGKTTGTGASDVPYLEVRLDFPTATTFTLDLYNLRAESGVMPQPHAHIDRDLELALCQRFYQKSCAYTQDVSTASSGTAGLVQWYGALPAGGQFYGMQRPYPVKMRGLPTVTWYNGANANAILWNSANTSVTSGQPSEGDCGFPIQPSASGTALASGHWEADAEISVS